MKLTPFSRKSRKSHSPNQQVVRLDRSFNFPTKIIINFIQSELIRGSLNEILEEIADQFWVLSVQEESLNSSLESIKKTQKARDSLSEISQH